MANSFELKSQVETLESLFGSERKYVIPGYQRPYEWKEENIEKAFDSLNECLGDTLDECEKCVFGTIQFNIRPSGECEIIDGQQRLTTFWLLLKALNWCGGSFSPENEINKCFKLDIDNVNDPDYPFTNPVYRKNYEKLNDLVSNQKKLDKQILIDHILKNIHLVVVETVFSNRASSVSKTLKIFDALNTTGLPLEAKDLFKINYCDCLNNGDSQIGQIFEGINEAYNTVITCSEEGTPYYLHEDDLLSTFKFWIIGNREESEISANWMKQSINEFYENLFQKTLPEYADLNHLKSIAESMKSTQDILKDLDSGVFGEFKDRIRPCAKELLAWSGYGQLKNLFYVFVYALANDQSVTKQIVCDALRLTEFIWKFCSVYHSVIGQIVNAVFACIGKKVLCSVVHDHFVNFDSIKDGIMNFIFGECRLEKEEFEIIIKGNIYENTRKDLFLALSFIDDCRALSSFEIKKQLFYYIKWEWDIEHILSQRFYGEGDPICHQIGNLVYLEKSINRQLGKKTEQANKALDDNKNKIEFYPKSKLKSICAIVDAIQASDSKELHSIVEQRNNEKQALLESCYCEVIQGLGKANPAIH